jgi:hypothetical protein
LAPLTTELFGTKEFEYVNESLKPIIIEDINSSDDLLEYHEFIQCIPAEDVKALLLSQIIIRQERNGKIDAAKENLKLLKKRYTTRGRMIFNTLRSGILQQIILHEWSSIKKKFNTETVRCKYFNELWRNVLSNPMYINGLFVGIQRKDEICQILSTAMVDKKKTFFTLWTRNSDNVQRVEEVTKIWIKEIAEEKNISLEMVRVDLQVVGEPAASFIILNPSLVEDENDDEIEKKTESS